MATICRLRNLSALRSITAFSSQLRPVQVCRLISTSDKKQDGAGTSSVTKPSASNLPDVPKTWVSWGFDDDNYYRDRAIAHLLYFSLVSIATIGFAYTMYYTPDMGAHEWSRREAFLELRRREAAGLPLVDPNYVPPSQVKLPSDEELGSFEIII